jgi:hypothetical protein
MKIAVNKDFGGFGVSPAVYVELGIEWDGFGYLENKHFGLEGRYVYAFRSHPKLIAAIEKIGQKEASGSLAKIRVIEIPDGIEWEISDYDGIETVEERHRSW